MHPDMLLLAERLVVAVERISQDVNNISAYVYDLSYNMSHFLNEKIVPCGEGDNFPSESSAAESEHFWQYEEGDGSSGSQTDNLEHDKTSVGDPLSMSSDRSEDTLGLPSFSEEVMIKEEPKSGNDESCHVYNTYGEWRDNVRDIVKGGTAECSDDCFPRTQDNHISFPVAATVDKDCTQTMTTPPGEEGSVTGTSKLEYDLKFDAEEVLFQCAICHETCCSENNLVVHMRVHSDERHYKCSICGKPFKESANLEKHMQLHGREKPFTCGECGKVFKQSSSFTTHMRSHTGEKPYKCSVCGKAFSVNSNLRVHMRSHTGEKPFKCSVCGKVFTQSGNLASHMRTHTSEKPYKCTVCGKAFAVNSNLTVHMRVLTGERPFPCETCESRFTTSDALQRHCFLVHGIPFSAS